MTVSEIDYVDTQRSTFNQAIKNIVATHGDGRVAVADFDGFFANLKSTMSVLEYAPTPQGIWSADALLPNAKGYMLMANKFIDAINNVFGATVPQGDLADVPGTEFILVK